MKRIVLLGALLFLRASATEDFWTQLTPAERTSAGVAELSPGQRAALDRLVSRYVSEGARQAVAEVKAVAKQEKAAHAGLDTADEEEIVRTRIKGVFRGWEGTTLFHFENGQVWQQTGSGEKFTTAPRTDPEAELRPSKLGGWKLYVSSLDRWVRVKRVR